jgi:hypothetical protein
LTPGSDWLGEESVTRLPAGTLPCGRLATAGRVKRLSMKLSRLAHQCLSQAISPVYWPLKVLLVMAVLLPAARGGFAGHRATERLAGVPAASPGLSWLASSSMRAWMLAVARVPCRSWCSRSIHACQKFTSRNISLYQG